MVKSIFKYIMLSVVLSFLGCHKNEIEPYNTPFVHIMLDETTSKNVSEAASFTDEYYIYLSSAERTTPLTVYFDIVAGNGLRKGVDYNIVTQGNFVTFLPGIYDIPIRIRYLRNPIDPAKDNTLKIVITGTDDESVSVGLPGPAHNQSSFLITKIQESI